MEPRVVTDHPTPICSRCGHTWPVGGSHWCHSTGLTSPPLEVPRLADRFEVGQMVYSAA